MTTYNLIPFKFDFDPNTIEKVEYKTSRVEDGVTKTAKVKVPIISHSSTHMQIIHSIHEFNKARRTLDWVDGAKLFNKFPDILNDYAAGAWFTEQIEDLEETEDNFDIVIGQFIQFKFSNNFDAYHNHKQFILNIKKNSNMTVNKFVSMVSYHNKAILPLLPGAPDDPNLAIIDGEDFKSLIYKSMPEQWRHTYEEHNSPFDNELHQIITRMERLHQKSIRNNCNNSNNNNTY